MTTSCLSLEDLATLRRLDPEDPRQRHARDCPRCAAAARSYREFLTDLDAPPGAQPGDAAERMHAAFRAALASGVDRNPAVIPKRGRPGWLWFPRPAWAALAVSAMLLIVYAGVRMSHGPGEVDVLRQAGGGTSVPAAFPILEAKPAADGAVSFRWSARPGPVAYSVRILAPALSEETTFGPVSDTMMVLATDSIRARLPGVREIAGWQVTASRDGREIAVSEIVPLRLPVP